MKQLLLLISLLVSISLSAEDTPYHTENNYLDFFVKQNTSTIYNTGSALRVKKYPGYARESFFFFDLTGEEVQGGNQKVEFKFHIYNTGALPTPAVELSLTKTGSVCTEEVNWYDKPSVGSALSTSEVVALDTWVTFDVTTVVNAAILAGEDSIGFNIFQSAGGTPAGEGVPISKQTTANAPSLAFYNPGAGDATLSGNVTITNGSTADLSVAFTGTAPFSFKYTDGSEDTTEVTGVTANPYTLSVLPTKPSIFTLTEMQDANGLGLVTGESRVEVEPIGAVRLDAVVDLYMYEYTSSAGNSYSDEDWLRLKSYTSYSRESAMMFTTGSLSKPVSSAYLSMYVDGASSTLSAGGTTLKVYALPESLNLTGTETWNASQSAFVSNGVLIDSCLVSSNDGNKRVYVDVTNAFDAYSNADISFYMTISNGDYVWIKSSLTSEKPQLVYGLDNVTEISQALKSNVSVFSHNGKLSLVSDMIIQRAMIYNISGALVYSTAPDAMNYTSPNMVSGVYLVKYMVDGIVEVQKVVVK